MLSYQHAYHAGCFADVIKHVVLTNILSYMIQKDKPLFYLETHAGRGLYDICDQHALKTKEASRGIDLLWANQAALPTVFSTYTKIIQQYNDANTLRFYPGSPAIAIHLLRPMDRLYLCELHPQEFEHLLRLPHQDKRVFCSQSDGIEQLKAQLPPPEHRGIVFIDPSYEIKSEYRTIPAAIQKAYRHFTNGLFCLWYPLIDRHLHDQLMKGLASIPANNQLRIEFHLSKTYQSGMKGCGLWIINPPFLLKEQAKTICQQLKTIFHDFGESTYELGTCMK